MNEFDESGSFYDGMATVTASPTYENDKEWPQSLATPGDDVISDLVDQRHRTFKASANDAIDALQVRTDQGSYFIEGHRDRKDCFGRGTHVSPTS